MPLFRKDFGLFKLMMIGTLVFLGLFYYFYFSSLQRSSISPESVWGGPIPAYLKAGLAFKTESGLLAQFVVEEENTKINMVVATAPSATPIDNPLDQLRLALKNEPHSLATFVVKFLIAQFDVRRATELKETSFEAADGVWKAQSFRAKKEEHYAVVIHTLPNRQQIALEGFTLDKHVNPELMQKVIRDLPLAHHMNKENDRSTGAGS